MENKGYVKDSETDVRESASGLELPSVAVRGSGQSNARRSSADSRHSTGDVDDRRQQTVHVAEVYQESELRPETRQHRRHSVTSVEASSAAPPEDDGFPWRATRKDDSVILTMRSELAGYESGDSRSPDRPERQTKCSNKFRWWHKMVKVLQDYRSEAPDANNQLLFLDQITETQFRLIKRIMNLLFLSMGMILLLAVIVLIVYTDPRFEESMKALTVFMAGRRRGLW